MSKSYKGEDREDPRRVVRQRERRALNQVLNQITLDNTSAEIEEMISLKVDKNPLKNLSEEQADVVNDKYYSQLDAADEHYWIEQDDLNEQK